MLNFHTYLQLYISYILLKKNKKFVEIWGDGLLDEIYVCEDFADILNRSIKKFDSLPELMNVGPGYDFSVKNYYFKIAKIIGYEGKFVFNKINQGSKEN